MEPASTIPRAPFPTDPDEFAGDDRIHYDSTTKSHHLEDERGEEWEFNYTISKWVSVVDEALIAQQQEIYNRDPNEHWPGDETRKRKASNEEESNGHAKKPKAEERKNNAIYVTSLPHDVTEDEIYDTFSKYGVIAESAENNKPRIKLYNDENGDFKGDALIVYFRSESVPMAINMTDETDFRLGQKLVTGPMRVTEADSSYKSQKEQPLKSEQAKTKGTGANRDRQKVIKKNEEMNRRLADWDDDDPQTVPDTSSRWDKVVVLKHMFTLESLAKDPAELLDIKEDVREEAEKFGTVTNVVLYDKEEEGVVTVRFSNAVAAQACVQKFDGRTFAGKKVEAYIADGKERFKKTRKQDENDEDEAARLESFGRFLEGEED